MNTQFCSENLKGRDHPEDLGVCGESVRMYVKEIVWDMDKWLAFVNTVLHLQVP
jgi:hypothetical protein